MARPQKDVLLYFPFDVDFFQDKKIRSLKVRFGTQGITMYIYILCMIYNEKGYYAEADEDFYDRVADDVGIPENTARQIMKYLCERSMLDGKLFTSVKILTSVKIQETFQEAKKGLKRDLNVNADYWLLNQDETLSFIKVTHFEGFSENNYSFSKNNSDKSEKNDTNKSKGNKRKINNSSSAAAVPYDGELERIITEYQNNIAPMKPMVRDAVIDWLNNVEADVIIYAIHEAVKHNVYNWQYIEIVISNHFNAGRTTLAQINSARGAYKSNPHNLDVYTDSTGYDYDSIEKIMQEKYDK